MRGAGYYIDEQTPAPAATIVVQAVDEVGGWVQLASIDDRFSLVLCLRVCRAEAVRSRANRPVNRGESGGAPSKQRFHSLPCAIQSQRSRCLYATQRGSARDKSETNAQYILTELRLPPTEAHSPPPMRLKLRSAVLVFDGLLAAAASTGHSVFRATHASASPRARLAHRPCDLTDPRRRPAHPFQCLAPNLTGAQLVRVSTAVFHLRRLGDRGCGRWRRRSRSLLGGFTPGSSPRLRSGLGSFGRFVLGGKRTEARLELRLMPLQATLEFQ